MADLIVVDEFYGWLLRDLRIGQAPSARPSSTIPSLWLRPDDGGIPAPRVPDEIVVLITTPIPEQVSPMDPWITESFVEVTTRSRNENAGVLIHRMIGSRIAPDDQPGGAKQWRMGAIDPVERSIRWQSTRALESVDRRTHLCRSGYMLQVRNKVLRGAI